ncbi:hypothetical protein AVEN_93564-1 [Araneus ventricosus]|uniref:Uncharacterized protein n=1 Tax=Araneus ventricosus TaxID=182803 RepID=A0A4Y2ARE1_ARAVE|nr:hypothetical protein AVEN_93564-1 [Araneus ventricosus]
MRELCSSKQLHRSVQLLNSALQLAAKDSDISKTDPKIQHSKHDAVIGIRSISDRRSKINSLLSSSLPQLKSSFSQERGPPNK